MTEEIYSHIVDNRRYIVRRVMIGGYCAYIETVWSYWSPWVQTDDLYGG